MLSEKYVQALLAAGRETVRQVKARPSAGAPGGDLVIDWPGEAAVSMHWLPSWAGLAQPNDAPMAAHTHTFFELMYVERGEFHNAVSGEAMVLNRDRVALISPGTPHSPYIRTDGDLVVNLMLKPALMERAVQYIGPRQGAVDRFISNYVYGIPSGVGDLIIPRTPAIDAVVERFVQVYYDREETFRERLRILTAELLMELCQSYSAVQPDVPDSQLSDIVRYMRAHYTTVTLGELSQVFHYSAAHLSRVIKGGLGKGFRELLTDYKVESACRLLRSSELTVSQIAELLHIGDAGYLSKLVKSSCGLTPTEYRHHMRDEPSGEMNG